MLQLSSAGNAFCNNDPLATAKAMKKLHIICNYCGDEGPNEEPIKEPGSNLTNEPTPLDLSGMIHTVLSDEGMFTPNF